MKLAEKHVVSSGQPRVCVADGAGWPCDTRLALDVVDALLSERSVPPPAAPGLDVERPDFDTLMADARVRVREELAQRCVDLMAAVELADTRTWAVTKRGDVVEEYGLKASDWNRVVAVARGHMSQKTRRSLDRFNERSFLAALTPATEEPKPDA